MCSGSAVDQFLLQSSSSETAGGAAEGGGLERLCPPPDGGGGGEQRNSGRNPGRPAASTDQVREIERERVFLTGQFVSRK